MSLVGYPSPVDDRPSDIVVFEGSWSILTFENSPEVHVPVHPTDSLGLTITDITNNNQHIKHCVYDRRLLGVCLVMRGSRKFCQRGSNFELSFRDERGSKQIQL